MEINKKNTVHFVENSTGTYPQFMVLGKGMLELLNAVEELKHLVSIPTFG